MAISHDSTHALDSLVVLLAKEQTAMELVCHRATAIALLAHAGEARFLPAAIDELEDSLSRLGTMEIMRAMAVADLAEMWGVPELELPLAAIALRSGPDHATILAGHLHALRALTKRLDRVVDDAQTVVVERLTGVSSGMARLASQLPTGDYWMGSDSSLG